MFLFFATIVVLLMVTASLLRWIEQLGYFGRVGDTVLRVETAAVECAGNWGAQPRLGARSAVALPQGSVPLHNRRTGYLQYVDMAKLQERAEAHDTRIYLLELPGRFVHPETALAHVFPPLSAEHRESLEHCFTVERDRSFTQDPRFGLVVLSEIASRALSPAVNDPGTAIAVLGSAVRVFSAYIEGRRQASSVVFNRIHAPELDLSEMLEDLFNPISRDGAGLIEVQLSRQKSLQAIAALEPEHLEPQVKLQSRRSAEHTARQPYTAHERSRVNAAAAWSAVSSTLSRLDLPAG